ncbi:hypothetical protein [Phormidium sp. CCY1219]|nr:hypothetical protein [Phormidium sp. CCY1219]MEB3831232.1 hypothetical protein [Phormidium sp. CCY1219]
MNSASIGESDLGESRIPKEQHEAEGEMEGVIIKGKQLSQRSPMVINS